jgi:hypothetical protein
MMQRFHSSPVLAAAGVRHGFTTRHAGSFKGAAQEGLHHLGQEAGFDPQVLCQVRQVHGTRVLALTAPARGLEEADGMTTAAPLCLAVQSADCVGLLLADGRGRVAAVHAGWRGTVAGIAQAAVQALMQLGADPAEIRAALGPSIGPCCFEVGEEVAARFAALVPEAVLRSDRPRPHVDLRIANRTLLLRAGLRPGHIDAAPPCTRCQAEHYFSYRRDGARSGQQLAFILGGTT